jgi:spoIIIJ-associated protein
VSDPGAEESRPAPDGVVEAEGETVGEAKWSALRELERRFPGLDKASVRFTVVSEGERGLLGVGRVPARVVAHAAEPPPTAPPASEEAGTPAAKLRELLERVCTALGAPCRIEIAEDEETLYATLTGPDLGLVIGKRGHTIDAIQYLANAVVWRGREERKEVVVDAAGYRERRRSALEGLADRAASDALQGHRPVALEPMTAVERKIVHVHLADREDVVTSSEGTEPSRHVVVAPAPRE